MTEHQVDSFPQFAQKRHNTEDQRVQERKNISPEKFQALKKQQLIDQITQNKQGKKDHNIQLTCFICHQYYVKAVLTKCGHSFCQFCLEEYFLFSNQCPLCNKVIREDQFMTNIALNYFVESFIRSHHPEYLQKYFERIKDFKNWKANQRPLGDFKAGMTLDVRDQNHVWCQGTVIRVLSIVNEPIKTLKIQYQNQNNFVQIQKIRTDDERLAPCGFYTNRKQIPKYQYLFQKAEKQLKKQYETKFSKIIQTS